MECAESNGAESGGFAVVAGGVGWTEVSARTGLGWAVRYSVVFKNRSTFVRFEHYPLFYHKVEKLRSGVARMCFSARTGLTDV